MKLQYTFIRQFLLRGTLGARLPPDPAEGVPPLCTPPHGRVYILLGCKYFMGYKHGWKQGPLHQEDNQAPQPTLHGLISLRDHSNVNHISLLKLSNICLKSLTYHLRAQRHYTYLPYKVEETNRTTYWANIHKKRKVPTKDHSSHVYEVIWSGDVQP